MKAGLLPLTLVTGVLIAAGVLVVLLAGASNGGGGGDTSTLEGYFQTLSTVQTDISTQYSTISGQYPQAFTDKQETLDYLDASAQAWSDGVDKLEAIEPPDAAEQTHQALVQATIDVSAAFATLRSSTEDANDEAALQALLNGADTSAFDDYGTACTALQTLADDNAVTDGTGAAIVLVC